MLLRTCSWVVCMHFVWFVILANVSMHVPSLIGWTGERGHRLLVFHGPVAKDLLAVFSHGCTSGVPGVVSNRFEEGMHIKHCALSLVGEPIMYPEINKFMDILHSRQISSFLVTNAQFPEEIRNLRPVTQLYVSIDASTEQSLKKIDRPLFKDFWPRFMDCLTAMSEKVSVCCCFRSCSNCIAQYCFAAVCLVVAAILSMGPRLAVLPPQHVISQRLHVLCMSFLP